MRGVFRRVMRVSLYYVVPIVLIVIWAVLSAAKIVPQLLLPNPISVLEAIAGAISSPGYNKDLQATMFRWVAGYLLGCAVGVPVGLLMGLFDTVRRLCEFTFEFFRTLPVTALFPVFLLIFGIGDESKIAMVFFGTVFIVALNSTYGVVNSTQARMKMAKAFGANAIQIFRYITFFEALPQILIGMRTSLSLSLIVVIISEMFIGTQFGLGQRIFSAYQRNNVVDLYATIFWVGLIGYGSNKLFLWIEKKYVHWAGQ